MPVLPTAEQLGARPVPRGAGGVVSYRPGVETPQYAAEVSLGRTIEGASDDLYRMEDQQNTRRAEDALTELRRRQLELTIGEKEGFANIKSKDAVSRPLMKEYGEKFDDAQKRIAEGLANTRQKERFTRRADIARMQYDEDLIRHITQQQNADAKQVLEGTLEVETQAASLRYGDSASIALSRERIVAAVDAYAAHSGWAPEQAKAARLGALSQMHAAVLGQQMAAGDDRAAKAYFKANRDEIEPKLAAQVQSALEVSSARGQSQRTFDKIIATKDEKDWIAAARAIDDPEERDQVETRVRQERALREAGRKDTEDKRFLNATNTVDETGSYLKIPPADWQQMSLQERAALKRYADDKRAGTQPTTNWGVLTRFTEMKPEDQAKLTQADLMREYRPRLDDGAYSHVLSRWQQARDAMEKPEKKKELTSILNAEERIAGSLNELNMLPKNKEDRAKMLYSFQKEVERQVQSKEYATGKKATPEEVQKEIDALMMKRGFVERGMLGVDSLWPDTEKHVSQMTTEERTKAYVPIAKIQPASLKVLLNKARLSGAVRIDMPDAEIVKRLGHRLERAYFLAITGLPDGTPATDAELSAILKGQR